MMLFIKYDNVELYSVYVIHVMAFLHFISPLFYSGSLPSISVDFKVTGVSTTKCSVYGGCYVTITGSGFPENKDITQISFGRAPCKITSLSSTQVQCQIDIARKVWFVDNSGIHPGESLFASSFSPVDVRVFPVEGTQPCIWVLAE